jgi:hypothetical protein
VPRLSNLATSKVSILLPRVNLTPALSFFIMLQELLSSKQSYSSYETILTLPILCAETSTPHARVFA